MRENLYGLYKINPDRQTGFYNRTNNQTTLSKLFKKLLNQKRLYVTFLTIQMLENNRRRI